MFRMIAVAALLAAPALAQSPGQAGVDHSKMDHSKMDHGAMPAPGNGSAMLKSSSPTSGAVLRQPPASLALTFAHPVVLQEVNLVSAGGRAMRLGGLAGSKPASAYQLKLPKLEKGAYAVDWKAGGQHRMSGRLTFEIR